MILWQCASCDKMIETTRDVCASCVFGGRETLAEDRHGDDIMVRHEIPSAPELN